MNSTQQIQQRRQQLLNQLANLEQIRRGCITEQYFEATLPDGTKRRRGPYRLHSFKHKTKTISRRLTNPNQVAAYRNQIDAFRQFQQITSELISIGERLSDLALQEPQAIKKKRSSKSSSRRK